MSLFNIRVYGILFDGDHNILISDEYEHETSFTKFPGGGLEYGEGTIEGLKREFMEECLLPIEVTGHFYTTDFFVKSVFNDTQVVNIYYLVKALETPGFRTSKIPLDFQGNEPTMQSFRWMSLDMLKASDMTFATEQHVVKLLKEGQYNFS